MTTYVWKAGTSGNWGVAGNWTATPSGFPNASTATVSIAAAATSSYTVTIPDNDSYTANTVTLNSSDAVLAVTGTLTLAGTAPTLTVTNGEFELNTDGKLVGGTVKVGAGGTLVIESGATLDGVTWQAPLTLAQHTGVFITGGLTVETASGGIPGSIDMTAGYDFLYVEDSETLNNATLNFGSNGGDAVENDNSSGGTLTLGSGLTIEQSGGADYLTNNYGGGTIANAGKINVSGGDLAVQGGSFTNSGSIAISGSGTVDLSGTALTNSGHISIGAGSELILGSNPSNTGSITIASTGTLGVAGLVTLSELTGITNSGGTLLVDGSGTLGLGGGTVDIATTGLFSDVVVDGELSDGTVKLAGGGIALANGATLDDVTWQGSLTFASSTNVFVTGGLKVETATGGVPGSIDMTAGNDTLSVLDSETLNNATLNFGSTGGDSLINDDVAAAGHTLTLGSGFIIEQSGGTNDLSSTSDYTGPVYDGPVETIANAGKIEVTGGDLVVGYPYYGSVNYLDNSGSIAISGSGTVDLTTTTLNNTGHISIGAGGELILGNNPTNATNSGTIAVTGGDLVVESYSGLGFGFTNSDSIAITGGGTADLSGASLSNSGHISVGAGSELILGTGFSNTGSITIASTGTLELTGTVTLSDLTGITNSGGTLIVASNGTLDLGGSTITIATTGLFSDVVVDGELSDGTVKLTSGSIKLNNATLDDITWQGPLTFAADAYLSVTGGLTVETATGGIPGSINMTAGGDSLFVLDSETLNNATLNFGSTGGNVIYNYDAASAGLTLTLGSGFVIEQSGGSNSLYNSYTADKIVNAGKIDVTGGDLSVQVGTFTNSGSIAISGGYVDIATTTFTSTGAITIGNGGTFEIAPATAANITYNDPANLILDDPSGYTGTLSGLSTGDTLQLDGENIASASISGTTLTVHFTGGGTHTYKTGPGLNGTTFAVSQGTDGFNDVLTVLCFLPGTLIATPAGETPVERLAVGDMIRTASGALRPIAWIGQGRVLATRGRRNAATPVVVSKSALGPNVPHHDLRVTKGHSFLLDGVLIPVEFLVNHRSIYWDDRAQEVTLYHVELETHDVLLANGAPAESYRDDGNRWLFQNANSGWDQPAKPPCAPVLTGGPIVDAAWRRLLDRAGGPTRLPLTQDAALALLVDGACMAPIVLHDRMAVFSLTGRPSELRLVSRSAVPTELGLARDARELGVAVKWIAVHKGSRCRMVGAEDVRLTQGFHAFEIDEGIRWTNGDALLPGELFAGFKGEFEVAIQLGGATSYAAEYGLRHAA
jgi:hypothetical protein